MNKELWKQTLNKNKMQKQERQDLYEGCAYGYTMHVYLSRVGYLACLPHIPVTTKIKFIIKPKASWIAQQRQK